MMTQPTPKKLLFISRHAPYGSSIAKEALDAVLAASAYEQDLSLLFMDDGVFQLLKNQDPTAIGQKNFSSILPALEFYDLQGIYVHAESLSARQLTHNDLVLDNIQLLTSAQIRKLMSQQEQILSF